MLQFAADDDVDSTLHDIKTELVAGNYNGSTLNWNGWDDDDTNDLYLQYENSGKVLDYGPYDPEQSPYFDVDSGWSKVLVRQCMNHDNENSNANKTDLQNQDLTNLFSGTVTVRVENQSIGSLTISKTVVDNTGDESNDDDKFEFKIEQTSEEDRINGSYASEKNGQVSENIVFKNGIATISLGDKDSIKIMGLPNGVVFKVTETLNKKYTTSNVVNSGTKDEDNIAENLTISNQTGATVEFTNTYEPTATFAFEKTDSSSEPQPLSGASFGIYELVCTDQSHEHEKEEIVVDENGNITDVTNGQISCWNLIKTATSDSSGVVDLGSLKTTSEYRLVEYKAPGGYVLPSGQWYVEYDNRFEVTGSTNASGTSAFEEIDNSGKIGINYRVRNYKPGELPLTGSKGITLFLLVGSSLMLLGGIIYIFRRKRSVI